MKKLIAVIASLAVFLPIAASAATFTNVSFQNGDVTISGNGGTTVQATFHVIVPANQVVENIQTDVIGDNLAPVCMSVGGDLGLQEGTHDVMLEVKMPPNTGTYTLNVQGSGIYGGIRSIDCNDTVVGTASFSGALRVVANSTTTNPPLGGGSVFGFSSFADFVTALKAALGVATPPPAPVETQECKAYHAALSGAVMNVVSPMNVRLQGFLLSQGANIPALAAGAAFGFAGPQTQAAMSWFSSANHCN